MLRPIRFCCPLVRSYGSGRLPSSPTSRPGYLIFDSIDDITSIKPNVKDKRPTNAIKALLGTDFRVSPRLLPSLGSVKSRNELGVMMKFYENQEPMKPIDAIKTSPSSRVARIEAFLQSVSSKLVNEDIEEAFELSAVGVAQLTSNEGFFEHIQCANVLKKRRARMRRHKHKKRLRKNRFKHKK